jgi:hypothetical protein
MKCISLLMAAMLVGCAHTPPMATNKSSASCATRFKQLGERYCALLLAEKNEVRTFDSFDRLGEDGLELEADCGAWEIPPGTPPGCKGLDL